MQSSHLSVTFWHTYSELLQLITLERNVEINSVLDLSTISSAIKNIIVVMHIVLLLFIQHQWL